MEIRITALAQDGRGIGFQTSASGRGKATFVPAAFPGQLVRCEPGRDHGNWQEATACEVLEDIPRVEADCSRFSQCGGCPWRPLDYAQQLEWKSRFIADAMTRIGKVSPDELAQAIQPVAPSPLQAFYRNKLQLAFAKDLTLGFRRRKSHEVIHVACCPAAEQGAIEMASVLQALARQAGLSGGQRGYLRHLVLRHGGRNGQQGWHVMLLTGKGSRERQKVRGIAEAALSTGLHSFIHEEVEPRNKRIFAIANIACADPAVFEMLLGHRNFLVDVGSFFQVNTAASQILAEKVAEADALCPGHGRLLDLFCGVGAPGLLLADRYKLVEGVEKDGRAIELARKNARDSGKWICADAGRFSLQTRPDTVLLDPPRQGVPKTLLGRICQAAPESIIYISCNPATLARDARMLGERFQLVSMAPVDMFPHTPHVEVCSLWRRQK